MAGHDDENELEWIQALKSQGAVPLIGLDDCRNCWASPPGGTFMVRGPEYFTSKVKIPAGDYLLKPLAFDWIKGPTKISEILNNPNSRVKRVLNEVLSTDTKPFVWAFNLQVPSKDNYSAVAYFVALEPIPNGSLMDQFLKGDDAFRNSRLKLIANIVKGPWIVRTAVGEQAICILGRAVSCKYYFGDNYIEVDVDIGASMVANAIVHLAFGYIQTLTVDLAFLIESQVESELPERLLGAVRFSELNPASAGPLEPPPLEDALGNPQSSLSTRLWKSIGQGFSQLLHPGAQDGSVSGSAHTNGHLHENEEGDNKRW
ncbi:hypothetical protein AMTRI_Chr06g200770 [Amborella trichopoda]